MNLGVYSYSKLKTYVQCPRKAKYKYVDGLPDPSGPAAERGKRIHDSLEQFAEHGSPLDSEISPVWAERLKHIVGKSFPELPFAFTRGGKETTFDDPKAFFRGVYDCVVPLCGEGEIAEELILYEYKTGKVRSEHEQQLGCYARSLFVKSPHLEKVYGRIVYLDYPDLDPCELIFNRGPKTKVLQTFLGPVKALDKQIKADNLATANPSVLCGWCSFSKKNGGPCEY